LFFKNPPDNLEESHKAAGGSAKTPVK